MNAKDLRERNTEDLVELRDMMKKDLFGHRMKNFTGQLDDTSVINKTRRDVARIRHEALRMHDLLRGLRHTLQVQGRLSHILFIG